MKTAVPPQERISQELWLWAKAQILSSLKPTQGVEKAMQDTRAVSAAIDESSGNASPGPSSNWPGPDKSSALVKASRTHQELHKELLLIHKKGLALHRKPELLLVLEKRRTENHNEEATLQSQTSLHQELEKWQQRREEKEQDEAQKKRGRNQELIDVRQNLRKSPWHDPQLSHRPMS
uniref:Actin-associated protein FAM107A-like n=1 Tax=Geotrypetes seraphini TaxID=260995 RepID=A0A6P8PB10_GEOSA|nr:actin-associated protein FAM107A-like [Geotrypetes seraphini]